MRLFAQNDDLSSQFRFDVSTHHDIVTNLTGSAHLEYFNNPDLQEQTFRIEWPGLTYTANSWLQLSAGFLTSYNDNNNSSDTLELRPSAGVKLFVPNDCKLH